jgi:hypothetical protein
MVFFSMYFAWHKCTVMFLLMWLSISAVPWQLCWAALFGSSMAVQIAE